MNAVSVRSADELGLLFGTSRAMTVLQFALMHAVVMHDNKGDGIEGSRRVGAWRPVVLEVDDQTEVGQITAFKIAIIPDVDPVKRKVAMEREHTLDTYWGAHHALLTARGSHTLALRG